MRPVGCGAATADPPDRLRGRGPIADRGGGLSRAFETPVEMPSLRSWTAARAVRRAPASCALRASAL
ncbi:hypothetical protein OIU85_001112 [Salix viminalis]|uniref:Uncharacterized protein n=1 Tax=Salix viminalis TaxID=40686 RepID=A0A9Q0ZXM9_SALVM|nr:hypothetical protein OIU85_001112 [Salix viminalis]